MVDLYNSSFDLLINGSLAAAATTVYESALTFNGIVWLWPILFIMTLILVAIMTENPTMIGMYAILGTVALGTLLPQLTNTIFWIVTILSVLIWFISLFVSSKLE